MFPIIFLILDLLIQTNLDVFADNMIFHLHTSSSSRNHGGLSSDGMVNSGTTSASCLARRVDERLLLDGPGKSSCSDVCSD